MLFFTFFLIYIFKLFMNLLMDANGSKTNKIKELNKE